MGNSQSESLKSTEHGREPESILSRMRSKLSRQQRRSTTNGTGEQDGGANLLSDADDAVQAANTDSQSIENKQNGLPQQPVEEVKELSEIEKLFKLSEQEVLETINTVIHKGKNPNTLARDRRGYSVLHLAAERNFLHVAEKLLDYGGDPLACDPQGNIPLQVAFEKNFDAMAALIISKTKYSIVRRLFGDDSSAHGKDDTTIANKGTANSIEMSPVGNASNKDETTNSDAQSETEENQERQFYKEEDNLDMFDIKSHLIDRDLTLSLAAVLDSLAEKNDNGLYTVYVKLLEEDNRGQEPGNEEFETKDHTVFHTIAAESRVRDV
ncbi:uncharacterized protein LOC123525848 [Mercenaria mercenaria]|uniref:uncharacterized protein LOC123525848 n=1 Tax=Mercenaria mercenaria TaxID=6596 RepID=UPI00234EE1FF|nr:uncharacterized protein LOC123525848 [Mercenaria mercenaria]